MTVESLSRQSRIAPLPAAGELAGPDAPARARAMVNGIPAIDAPGVDGTLRISAFGSSVRPGKPNRFSTEIVNGPDYSGMTDNDLRGCLDGTVPRPWNQATQVHVRVGRVHSATTPLYGEFELFRVLQRWDGIRLPQGAELISCEIVMEVEEAPPVATRLLLYAARRDWGAGRGGIDRNNVSPPGTGEVWWGAARHEQEPWGLPGAAFASDTDPDADTWAAPVAQCVCTPGTPQVRFASDALTRYAADRIAAGEPLLFLIKVSDTQEDVPGVFLSMYSGEFGDSRNTARRPRLRLEWESATEEVIVDEKVSIERGRDRVFGRFAVREGTRLAADFRGTPGFDVPVLEARLGSAESTEPWTRFGMGLSVGAAREWIELRVSAFENAVPLGEAFTADLVDTWVVSGPAEDQLVRWTFVSPTGVEHTRDASYEGRFRWTVRFLPDEPGTWDYRWTHHFFRTPVAGPVGHFDVVAGAPEVLHSTLEGLAADARRASPTALLRLRVLFSRLERLAMRYEHPATFAARRGPALGEALQNARAALWGRPVPSPIPLEGYPLRHELKGRRFRDPVPRTREFGLGSMVRRDRRAMAKVWIRRFLRRAGEVTGPVRAKLPGLS